MTKLLLLLMVVIALGCPSGDRPGYTAGFGDSAAAAAAAIRPSHVGVWDVTPFGIGLVRAGMSLAAAEKALGTPLTMLGDSASCDYAQPTKASPDSVLFMVVDGQIARVDVTGNAVATVEGARIGDSEARVDSLYRGRVTVQPHEYSDGHYLVVRAAAESDTTHRIIFETDGKVVTTFRSGRMPEVAWVEGCS